MIFLKLRVVYINKDDDRKIENSIVRAIIFIEDTEI